MGFGYDSLEKIGKLSLNDRGAIIDRLGAFPGHRAKLMSVFEAIKNVNLTLTIRFQVQIKSHRLKKLRSKRELTKCQW